jgi:hypothetical protein
MANERGEMMSEIVEETQAFIDAQPTAAWPLRLPIIRHVRAIILSVKLANHYSAWEAMGAIAWDANKDYAVRDAIWRGEK